MLLDVAHDSDEFHRIDIIVNERGWEIERVDIAVNVPRYDIEDGSLFDIHEVLPMLRRIKVREIDTLRIFLLFLHDQIDKSQYIGFLQDFCWPAVTKPIARSMAPVPHLKSEFVMKVG